MSNPPNRTSSDEDDSILQTESQPSTAGRRRRTSIPSAMNETLKNSDEDKLGSATSSAALGSGRSARSLASAPTPRSNSSGDSVPSVQSSWSVASSSVSNSGSRSTKSTTSGSADQLSTRSSSSSSSIGHQQAGYTQSTPAGLGRSFESDNEGQSPSKHGLHSLSASILDSASSPPPNASDISSSGHKGSSYDGTSSRKSHGAGSVTSGRRHHKSSAASGPASNNTASAPAVPTSVSSSSLNSTLSSTSSASSSSHERSSSRSGRPHGEWRQLKEVPVMQFLYIQGIKHQREWVGHKSATHATGVPGIVAPGADWFCTCTTELIKATAERADPEDWGTDHHELSYYLQRTWHRATNLSREHSTIVAYYPNGELHPTIIMFHTGLLSKDSKGFLYGVLSLRRNLGTTKPITQGGKRNGADPMWLLQEILTTDVLLNGHVMSTKDLAGIRRHQLPLKVWYWTSHVSELYYDPDIPIEDSIDAHHLFGDAGSERRNRLPLAYRHQSKAELEARLRESVRRMKWYAEAAPRMVIPQYFWDKHNVAGQLQLLLPIALGYDKSKDVDCCVVLRREQNNAYSSDEMLEDGPRNYFYRIISLYSLAMAYSNARLIQPVDAAWLLNGHLQSSRKNNSGELVEADPSYTDQVKSRGHSASGWTSPGSDRSSRSGHGGYDDVDSEASDDSVTHYQGSISLPSLEATLSAKLGRPNPTFARTASEGRTGDSAYNRTATAPQVRRSTPIAVADSSFAMASGAKPRALPVIPESPLQARRNLYEEPATAPPLLPLGNISPSSSWGSMTSNSTGLHSAADVQGEMSLTPTSQSREQRNSPSLSETTSPVSTSPPTVSDSPFKSSSPLTAGMTDTYRADELAASSSTPPQFSTTIPIHPSLLQGMLTWAKPGTLDPSAGGSVPVLVLSSQAIAAAQSQQQASLQHPQPVWTGSSSSGKAHIVKPKVIRVAPDIKDYSDTGYVHMVRAVFRWMSSHPGADPATCELAQLAPLLHRYLPELKGTGKCHAYAVQAMEAGVIDMRLDKKQNYVTLTPKGAALKATSKRKREKKAARLDPIGLSPLSMLNPVSPPSRRKKHRRRKRGGGSSATPSHSSSSHSTMESSSSPESSPRPS